MRLIIPSPSSLQLPLLPSAKSLFPVQNANHHRNNNSHYKVSLSGISHRAPGSSAAKPVPGASFPVPIIVDSGTTLSLLPKGVVASLAAQFSGAKSDNKGGYTVPCEHQARDGSVVFAFGLGAEVGAGPEALFAFGAGDGVGSGNGAT